MKKKSHKFESEVHLGLLAIILVLLVLNAGSNYVSYHARVAEHDRVEGRLNDAALIISRRLESFGRPQLTKEQQLKLRREQSLSRLVYLPVTPALSRPSVDSAWLSTLKPLQSGLGDVVQYLDGAEFRRIVRGDKDEYLLLYPMPGRVGHGLLVVARRAPLLAYLDTAGRTMVAVGIVAALLVLAVYVMLSRFVLSPFRRIRQEALQAGRVVDDGADEVEAMVADYRRIIEELKAQEAQLRRLNQETQQRADSIQQFNEHLLSSIDSGIITVDQRGIVKSINAAALDILDVSSEEYQGKHYWELLGSNVHLVDAVSRVLDCGKNQAYRETEFSRPAKSVLALGVTISVIHDRMGQPLGASLLINNLTELAALRRQLEAKGRLAALGEMAGGLAHQVRNSLGAIAGYGNLVKKKLSNLSLPVEHATALVQETREAESLIERFLYFARPLNFQPDRLDVVDLIKELLAGFRVRADCASITFVDKTKGVVAVDSDGLLLKQALTNLIENGVNAHHSGCGTVTVECRETNDEVQIEISDTGCGLDSETTANMFTPFFSTRPSGSGLGLPLVKKIIDLHGGRLSHRSEPGIGTTFTIGLARRLPELGSASTSGVGTTVLGS
ncbi:MAG: ATP-binding protein [candidate division Zixibacteria bacterium]|nr:ATP-binding protein [candidate division Zixibacteria bacterium]MDH3938523.1 ATP-binding protein [candidate division Zixibacteria bacterium]MDH4033437.1 ATP-binding protein [candidate division Zixibacteria bacterium]